MVRPKRGTPGHEASVEKWRATMLAKYGTKEELHKKMQEIGRLGGSHKGNKGFALNKTLARAAGSKGGRASRRGEQLRNDEGVTVNRDGSLSRYRRKE